MSSLAGPSLSFNAVTQEKEKRRPGKSHNYNRIKPNTIALRRSLGRYYRVIIYKNSKRIDILFNNIIIILLYTTLRAYSLTTIKF